MKWPRLIGICCLLILSCFLTSAAQTYLQDPGFEEIWTCPKDNLGPEQLRYWSSTYAIRPSSPLVPWYYQSYHHICDPAVEVYWKPILGNGVIKIPYQIDTNTDEVMTALLWTKLNESLQKDEIYYIEYTTAPTHFYYPPDQQFYSYWCVSPNLGLSFATEEILDTLSNESFLSPLYRAEDGGQAARAANTLVIGNCYRATGEEEYLLFGHFRHSRNEADDRCLGSAINSQFGTSVSLVDNFRLEKMKLEICCDSVFCSADLADFSSYTQQYVYPPGTIFSWSDGAQGLQRSFAQSGSYQLTVEMPCGSISSNWIDITVNPDCSERIFVPNAFSPNQDGLNDYFLPLLSTDYEMEIFRFSIFDRWGQEVYRFINNSPGWDGTIRGRPAPIGVYTWALTYQISIGDKPVTRSKAGSVNLTR